MKVYLEVYGCTANKSDAALIKGLIQNHPDYMLVNESEDAELIVLVTCTVIGTTEQRMLHRMRILHKMGKPVIVTGCMASVQFKKISSVLPNATIVPPDQCHTLFLRYDKKKSKGGYQEKSLAPRYFDSLIAPISISEGCRYSCAYCITCLARGPLHSFSPSSIEKSFTTAVHQGCKEFQLTAQDTASYGHESHSSLSDLLGLLCSINGDYRIRVGMMNPRSVINQIDDIAYSINHPKIYRFLHLPVQSGDNYILQIMKRGYTVNEFIDLIYRFRELIPDLTLATDIIVGFPTENDEQFRASMNLIQTIKPDIVNITRFSARPQTLAKLMKGRIPTEIVKERSTRLTNLCQRISLEKNQQYIGTEEMVLTLEKGKSDTIVGRTQSYKSVVIKERVGCGHFVPVNIIDAKATHLVGLLK
jgi:MiaB-like tRNA modifying enzyme